MTDFEDFTLLNVERNNLLDLVKKNELDPGIFKLHEQPGESPGTVNLVRLVVPADITEFVFSFYMTSGRNYACAVYPHLDRKQNHTAGNWETVLSYFIKWLRIIRYELNTPNMWKSITATPMMASNAESYTQEEKFTSAEVDVVRERLAKIEAFITEKAEATPEQKTVIHQRFVYLSIKAETSSKIDWKNIVASEIVSLVVQFAQAQHEAIFTYCNEQLIPFFRHFLKLGDG